MREGASPIDRLKALFLYPLPHHLLSRVVLVLTRMRSRSWKSLLISWFVRIFSVDLEEALEPDPAAYPSFNAFFTRALRPGARPLAEDPREVVSPVDGAISRAGTLDEDRLLQAKGHSYSLEALLGGAPHRVNPFRGGRFVTLYLSPRDYHRIHMPCSGRLLETVYIPGRLYPVAPFSVRTVPGLFARNERLVALFDTVCGVMCMVLVGALFVGCIETVFQGIVTPPHGRRSRTRDFRESQPPVRLERGEEMGRFNMGSTVILLFGRRVPWHSIPAPESAVRMGQGLGLRLAPESDTGGADSPTGRTGPL